jgi:hypothetical protein
MVEQVLYYSRCQSIITVQQRRIHIAMINTKTHLKDTAEDHRVRLHEAVEDGEEAHEETEHVRAGERGRLSRILVL